MKYPKAAKDWLTFLGSKGGSKNTPAQQAARSANAKRATEVRTKKQAKA